MQCPRISSRSSSRLPVPGGWRSAHRPYRYSRCPSLKGTAPGQWRSIIILRKERSNMGIFTKDIKSMEDLLIHGLQDTHYAEQQILKALPKRETNKQVERLDNVFGKLGKQPTGTQCPAIDGIIKEADETAGEIEDKA